MNKHFSLPAAAAALAIGMGCPAAFATDGYFMDGYGANQTAVAGAGVAYSQDAMAISLNPAGLVNVDDQVALGISAFMPFRSYSAGNSPFGAAYDAVTPGDHDSNNDIFGIPNFAWTHHLGSDTVLGAGLYGNGGMNTTWPVAVFPAACKNPLNCPGGGFNFGSAPTGVDLQQAFMSVSLSQRFGQVSVGVAPILAMQTFKATGLGAFAGYTVNPSALSDNGFAFSYGGGVRAGIEYDYSPDLHFAVAGSSRIYMTDFDVYKGLFAGGGAFDIPATITAGLSYNVRPNVTVMLDYKHIFYSDIPSIANPLTNLSSLGIPFGASNGPGFGWQDINIYKLGLEWRYDPRWTFRAGYSYNDEPITARDVMVNILAPGVVQNHITGGFKYAWSEKIDLEFAAMYAPETTVKGTAPASFGAQPISISMYQVETTLGIVYHFDGRRELEPLK
ncbi:MAG: OmpP1/FadL family transporter [Rhodomicrobium sp.]